jgi:hypothetical protein
LQVVDDNQLLVPLFKHLTYSVVLLYLQSWSTVPDRQQARQIMLEVCTVRDRQGGLREHCEG